MLPQWCGSSWIQVHLLLVKPRIHYWRGAQTSTRLAMVMPIDAMNGWILPVSGIVVSKAMGFPCFSCRQQHLSRNCFASADAAFVAICLIGSLAWLGDPALKGTQSCSWYTVGDFSPARFSIQVCRWLAGKSTIQSSACDLHIRIWVNSTLRHWGDQMIKLVQLRTSLPALGASFPHCSDLSVTGCPCCP